MSAEDLNDKARWARLVHLLVGLLAAPAARVV
jgi:hypothetical protein